MVGAPRAPAESRIGVLAVQGSFSAHAQVLARIGARTEVVRDPAQVSGLAGLVLPGGESTAMIHLMRANGLWDAVAEYLASDRPVLATCAGTILVAREVLDGRPGQDSFGAIDITVRRNGFGRQVDSFEEDLRVPGDPLLHGVFIRAPRIERTGPSVQVLAWTEGNNQRSPVLCRSGPLVVATFHPELTRDDRVHLAAFGAILGARVPAWSGVLSCPA